MLRSVLAVIAGYLAMMVAVTTFFSFMVYVVLGGLPSDPKQFSPPAWLYVVELATTPIVAGVGGYVCAWIAKRRVMRHVFALGGVMLVMTIVSTVGAPASDPWWHMPAIGILGAIGAILGGRVRLAHRDATT